jgi:hypothetical protein
MLTKSRDEVEEGKTVHYLMLIKNTDEMEDASIMIGL